MGWSIYLNVVLIIVLVVMSLIFRKMNRINKSRIYVAETRIENLLEKNSELHNLNRDFKHQVKKNELSYKNLKSALLYKQLDDGKRHISLGSIDGGEQEVVIFFDEEWNYTSEYFKQNPLCNKEPFIRTIKLNCLVFIDGKTFDPILISEIAKNSTSVTMSSIDCGKYKGRGLGTCVIKHLTEILKVLKIEELKASLSPHDYKSKPQLYNFYINMNGFELLSELTEDSWGKVIKKISYA